MGWGPDGPDQFLDHLTVITNGKTLIACYIFVIYTLIIIRQEQKVGPVRMYPWGIPDMNIEQ